MKTKTMLFGTYWRGAYSSFTRLLALLLCFSLISCEIFEEQELDKSQLQFIISSPGGPSQTLGKAELQSSTLENASSVTVTLENTDNGNSIDETIELLSFGGSYMTKPISVVAGSYRLNKLIVLDAANSAIYASPRANSEKTYLVQKPLPVNFSAAKDQVATVAPEVVSVTEDIPEDFGYLSLEPNPISVFQFQAAVFVGDILVPADLRVKNGDNLIYQTKLDKKSNIIELPDNRGIKNYTLIASKNGYNDWEQPFTHSELKTAYNNPLKIYLEVDPSRDAMVAYYPLNGDVDDHSGFENHGTPIDAVSTAGVVGDSTAGAYLFNGSSAYLRIADNIYFKPTREISYSLWAYFPSGKSGGKMCSDAGDEIFMSVLKDSGGYEMYCEKDSNSIGARIHVDGGVSNPLGVSFEITGDDLLDNWHNIAVVYESDDDTGDASDDGSLSVYFDGVSKGSLAVNSGNIDYSGGTSPLIIGASAALNGYFTGKIDEVRIYERALSAAEIQNLFNQALPSPWTGTQQFGSSGQDYGYAITRDSYGNLYVAGSTLGDMDGNTNAGGRDFFLVKYNSGGVKQWTRQMGSADLDEAWGVSVDSDGNAYVAGYTYGDLDGNTNAGGEDLVLVKYNIAGVKQWTRLLGTPDDDRAWAVSVDSSGNAYVAGHTYGGLDGNTNAGGRDILLVKYNNGGDKQWTRQMGTAGDDRALGVSVDNAGNAYVTGSNYYDLDGNTSAGNYDFFLVKYNSGGDKQWTRQMGSADLDEAWGVSVDSDGNAYVAGYTYGDLDGNTSVGGRDIFLVKYDSGGVKQWTQQLGTADHDRAYGVSVDNAGNAYVTGYTGGALDGNTYAGGTADFFLVKYNSGGVKQWTRLLGTASYDLSYGVSVDGAGNAYVVGHTSGDLDGNTKVGFTDFFLVKYNSDGVLQ